MKEEKVFSLLHPPSNLYIFHPVLLLLCHQSEPKNVFSLVICFLHCYKRYILNESWYWVIFPFNLVCHALCKEWEVVMCMGTIKDDVIRGLCFVTAAGLDEDLGINKKSSLTLLKIHVSCEFRPIEQLQFDLHFLRLTFDCLHLSLNITTRWWRLKNMKWDTSENLHLLFGNQAWICIYLHFYFSHVRDNFLSSECESDRKCWDAEFPSFSTSSSSFSPIISAKVPSQNFDDISLLLLLQLRFMTKCRRRAFPHPKVKPKSGIRE